MNIVDLLAKLDWFEHVDALFKVRTPSHRLVVDRNCGWSGQQIEDMLKRYGIKVWDRGFTENTLRFRVKQVQARYAEYLLLRHGIPVKSKLVDPRNAMYGPGQPATTPPQQKDGVLKIIDSLWN